MGLGALWPKGYVKLSNHKACHIQCSIVAIVFTLVELHMVCDNMHYVGNHKGGPKLEASKEVLTNIMEY